MDNHNLSKLLSYAVCELSMPVKKHIYNYVMEDLISMNKIVLSAAVQTVKSQKDKNLKSQEYHQFNSNQVEIDGDFISEEPVELYEGTEIEKGALADIFQEEGGEHYFGTYSANTLLNGNNENSLEKPSSTIDSVKLSPSSTIVAQRKDTKKLKDKLLTNKPLVTGGAVVEVLGEKVHHDSGKHGHYFEPSDEITNTIEENIDISELYSDPLLLCNEADFKTMFRIKRSTFQILVELLSREDMEPIENVPLYKKLLIVLWLFGNSGSYSDAAQVFEVSEEIAANCFFDVCATLYNKSENFIKWPTSDECNEIASRIEEKYGFPGVVGVLGCHYFSISIPKEALSRREHFNGNLRTYCVSLQIVCDDELVIRDIFPGLPGGVLPAQVWRDSTLCEQLASKTQQLDPHKHILARSEYPQLMSMLTPYAKSAELLNKDELEFNALHENVCILVDQTFQMLQNRFCTLKLLDPEVATMMLVTTCVLHNICVQNGDIFKAAEHEEG